MPAPAGRANPPGREVRAEGPLQGPSAAGFQNPVRTQPRGPGHTHPPGAAEPPAPPRRGPRRERALEARGAGSSAHLGVHVPQWPSAASLTSPSVVPGAGQPKPAAPRSPSTGSPAPRLRVGLCWRLVTRARAESSGSECAIG